MAAADDLILQADTIQPHWTIRARQLRAVASILCVILASPIRFAVWGEQMILIVANVNSLGSIQICDCIASFKLTTPISNVGANKSNTTFTTRH